MVADEGVDIFPVNFFVRDHLIFFRSAPGAKLVELTKQPNVAFEIDGTNRDTSWSVVTKGQANRMGSDLEIEKSGVLGLYSASPTEKWNYVRITPASVTGRRFRTSRQPSYFE
jgi:nitroimidazol reductase NimA-like FMN-containing flavoprotein (pyridoxamine 5'-phosphate oxidase superfamily)